MTLEFLSLVLPFEGQGIYCAGAKNHMRWARTFSELLQIMQQFPSTNEDLYFSPAAYSES